jgi:hypothetical protein
MGQAGPSLPRGCKTHSLLGAVWLRESGGIALNTLLHLEL